MTESDFRNSLYEWRVPKWMTIGVTKEMEILGLIKRVRKNNITLSVPKFKEDNHNFYYKKLKIF